jgi:hypothetical protein
VDEVVARLIEDQMAGELGLYRHTPEQQVHELSSYPVRVTVEQYTHLRAQWQEQHGPGKDPESMARYTLRYLFAETAR